MFIETLKRLAQCQGKKVGNIVHIGAGDCEELEFYEMQNPDQIILVDANVSVCKRLKEQTDGMENCRVIQRAVTQKQSDFILHQYNNIKLNSNMSPKELEKNFPGIKLVSSSQIQSVSIDSFFDGLDLVSNTSKISVLVLDNCGMNSELLADNLCQRLKGFDYIIIRSLRYREEYGINLKAEKEFELIQLNESGLFYESVYKQKTFYIQYIEQTDIATTQSNKLSEQSGVVDKLSQENSELKTEIEQNAKECESQKFELGKQNNEIEKLVKELSEKNKYLEEQERINRELSSIQQEIDQEVLKVETQLELFKDVVLSGNES